MIVKLLIRRITSEMSYLNNKIDSAQLSRKGEKMKIAVVTDSTAYLAPQYCRDHHITVLPLMTNFGNDSYREMIDIGFEAFYAKLASSPELPTSSQPSIGKVEEAFAKLSKNHDYILAFTLSKEISGTYQTMRMVGEQMSNIEVYVFDSQISCQGQAFLVEAAVRYIEAGMPVRDIIASLQQLQQTLAAYFVVEDLSHLTRGGRLSASSAMIGSLFKIKPILYFNQGKIEVFEKIRTTKKAIKRLEDLFKDAVAKNDKPLKVSIEATPNVPAVKELQQYFKANYPELTVTTNIIGPVIGTHLGPGAFGIAWIADDEKQPCLQKMST